MNHVKCFIQDKAELMKAKVKVNSAAFATTKFLFGMCNCTVDIDVGTGDFSLLLGILHVSGHAHVRSYMSPCMDCSLAKCKEIRSI